MAAVSTSPPPMSASPAAGLQERLPRSPMGDQVVSRTPLAAPVGYAPSDGAPRIRDAPVSPVRVNFQQGNWTQPSNVDIEHMQPRAAHISLADRTRYRDSDFTTAPSSPQGSAFFREGSPRIPQPTAFSPSSSAFPHRQSPQRTPSGTAEDAGHSLRDHGLGASAARDEYETPTITSPVNPAERIRQQELYRNSRESDETASTQQQASTQSSAATSASSVSGINENTECQPLDDSPGSSVVEGQGPGLQSVPQFQYHHHQPRPLPRVNSIPNEVRTVSSPDLIDGAGDPRRHLTPTSQYFRRSSLPRPQSSYSVHSELAPRGRSPGLMPGGPHLRAPSVQSRKSPDVRLSSYAELLNVPYPQQAPAPLTLDNSNLRTVIGNNASLLSTQKTLEMYRQNVKKTNDPSILYSFAVFLISTAQEQGLDITDPKGRKVSPQPLRDHDSPIIEATVTSPYELVREARQILQRLSSSGYPFAQYYLADGYASGLFNKGKEDYNSAFPLFVLAAKHGHAESAYRTALCYEFGWGCRRDAVKAVQFLRSAASKRHPGAMTRLGKACLSGDLGEKRYREGIKWMKLATEAADHQYNAAPYQLGCLYETGYGDDIFGDEHYAAELFTMAADLGHPEANFRMGDAYEHGRLQCPRDPSLSVHFYTGAAERGHAPAMMGLCAWYMVGAPPILDKDEEEAYEWASKSAQLGFVKAQYAVGYFTEMGIGCRRDILEANVWYVKAADAGDQRAKQRLAIIEAAVSGGEGTPMQVAPPRSGKITKDGNEKECIVM